MELIKDYYDVDSLLEILSDRFKIKFSSYDLISWMESNLLTPHYRYKGYGALAFPTTDKGWYQIIAKGYCELYLSDNETSLGLIKKFYYEKNRRVVSHFTGFSILEHVCETKYENADKEFNSILDLYSKYSNSRGLFYFLSKYELFEKLFNKYDFEESSLKDGRGKVLRTEYEMESTEKISYAQYVSMDSSPPYKDFLDEDQLASWFNDYNKKVGINDMLIPHSQVQGLINFYSQIIESKDNKKTSNLHPRTANNASKIISALCELSALDITQPYGNTNKEIMSVLDRLGTPLSKDVIGDWLKLAHENTK